MKQAFGKIGDLIMLNIVTKYYFIIFIFLFTTNIQAENQRAVVVTLHSPDGEEVKGNQWLFIIGINSYIHWPTLNTAENDATAVRDMLLKRYFFDKDHLIELYNEQATRKNILSNLRFLAKTIQLNDSLVIFFAGHGHLDSITKAGSWIPVESDIEESSAWITNHEIKNYLKIDVIRAKHVLLISDSCFSGDFFRGHRGKLPEVNNEVIKRAYKLTSRQAITSGGIEPVTDVGFGGNSVFTYFFLKMLSENKKPYFIPSDFFSEVKAGVVENAEQLPRFGTLRDTGGQQGGELVFFLRQQDKLNDLLSVTKDKWAELKHLEKLEKYAEVAKEKEAAEIAERERELAKLDNKIGEMRRRLGLMVNKADGNLGLDDILKLVQQKEEQEKRLEEIRSKRKDAIHKREMEIKRLKKEKEKNIIAMLTEDVGKYKKIVGSKFGQGFEIAAWNSLISKCPPEWVEGVTVGDVESLLLSPERRRSISEGLISLEFEPDEFVFDRNTELKELKLLKLTKKEYEFESSSESFKFVAKQSKLKVDTHGRIEGRVRVMARTSASTIVYIVNINNNKFDPTFFRSFVPGLSLNTSKNNFYGYIVLLNNPYFALTNRSGQFIIENVPPGRYTLKTWHEKFKPVTNEVVVKTGETSEIRLPTMKKKR